MRLALSESLLRQTHNHRWFSETPVRQQIQEFLPDSALPVVLWVWVVPVVLAPAWAVHCLRQAALVREHFPPPGSAPLSQTQNFDPFHEPDPKGIPPLSAHSGKLVLVPLLEQSPSGPHLQILFLSETERYVTFLPMVIRSTHIFGTGRKCQKHCQYHE